MININPFKRHWRLCKEVFLYRNFSTFSDEFFSYIEKDGVLEKKSVYESTHLTLFEATQRWLDSENCYVRHKDNLAGHTLLDEVSEEEIENAERFATQLSAERLSQYFNTARRLS